VIGTYHYMRERHLHRYTAEFDFRYNIKDLSDRERSDLALKGIEGKRLTYRRTISSPPNYYAPPPWIGERRKRWTR
jgi:hypothetical protein